MDIWKLRVGAERPVSTLLHGSRWRVELAQHGGGSKYAKNRYGSRVIGAKGKGMIGKDEGMWRIKEYP